MQMYAYRATERGAHHILSTRLEDERRKLQRAQRAIYEAKAALATERQRQAAENIATSLAMMAELRAQGIRYRHSFAGLERRTCRLFKISKAELRSDRRHRDIVFARQFLMYWAVRLTKRSLPEIGRLLGGKDHTTILHGKRVYPQKRESMGRYLRPTR